MTTPLERTMNLAMTTPLERTMHLATALRNQKRLCTGSALNDPGVIKAGYEEDFAGLVTIVYRWFCESLQMDREYLDSTGREPQRVVLKRVNNVLRQQRHDIQHVNYRWAAEAKAWRDRIVSDASVDMDRAAALKDGLLLELGDALEILCDLAAAVRADAKETKAWQVRASTVPENEIRAVWRNLGVRSPRNMDFIVRQFTSHPELKNAHNSSERARIAEAVAVGSALRVLSIDYTTLLDHFGLISKPDAWALLLLAHGVEQRGHIESGTLDVLEKIWPVVSASA